MHVRENRPAINVAKLRELFVTSDNDFIRVAHNNDPVSPKNYFPGPK